MKQGEFLGFFHIFDLIIARHFKQMARFVRVPLIDVDIGEEDFPSFPELKNRKCCRKYTKHKCCQIFSGFNMLVMFAAGCLIWGHRLKVTAGKKKRFCTLKRKNTNPPKKHGCRFF
jgi:hypothetical protein